MLKRSAYITELLGYREKHIIKVVTGVRRCGKSTLLELYRKKLRSLGVEDTRIISLNFENMELKDLTDAENLHRYVTKKMVKGKMNYIFFDEVQMVSDFPRVVDSLFIKKNTDIYITGSNQFLLSGELATLLTGRYITINMMPLSFREFADQYKKSPGPERIYEDYLRYSSFPFALEFGRDLRQVKAYLEGIYNTIVMRDVAARRNIVDLSALDSVSRFIFDNIGNLTSIKKIADTMQSSGRKISVPSVESYIASLAESFMVYRAKRYDVKGKRQLLINDKYYVIDLALRSTLLGEKSLEVSHALENVIFLELVRRHSEVYVGKIGDLEVDFIAMRHGSPLYYQVAATVRDSAVLKRELAPLLHIHDSYPKYLLTLDRDPPAWHEGIRSMNALDFLLGKDGE
ncbi:ATPase [Spirochaetia bacterium]|nr:ATPase [Spirochaetia bacterium]